MLGRSCAVKGVENSALAGWLRPRVALGRSMSGDTAGTGPLVAESVKIKGMLSGPRRGATLPAFQASSLWVFPSKL